MQIGSTDYGILDKAALEEEMRKNAKISATPSDGPSIGNADDAEAALRQRTQNLHSDTDLVSLSPLARERTRAAESQESETDPESGKSGGARFKSGNPEEEGGNDPIAAIRKQIREVEKRLKEAQAKMAAAAQEAQKERTAEDEDGESGEGKTDEPQALLEQSDSSGAQQTTAEAELNAAEQEVSELSNQLLQLYKQLMDAQQD